MIRQTGGTAVGEISTRSRPFCFAMVSACGGGMIPSCCPVSSMTRISRTRMRSLTRTRSSLRGDLSKAITTSCDSSDFGLRQLRIGHPIAYFGERAADEGRQRLRALVAALARPHRDGAVSALAVADDQHVRHLLQLRLADLIADLFLPIVELRTQTGGLEPFEHAAAVIEVPIGDRQDHGLDRRQPQRQGTRIVL